MSLLFSFTKVTLVFLKCSAHTFLGLRINDQNLLFFMKKVFIFFTSFFIGMSSIFNFLSVIIDFVSSFLLIQSEYFLLLQIETIFF